MILTPLINQVEGLIEKYDLIMDYAQDSYAAQACPGSRKVYVPDIEDLITYQTCLHEIGHFASGYGFPYETRFNYHRILFCELAAWDWAYETALIWTEDMNEEMKMCLYDYRSSEKLFPLIGQNRRRLERYDSIMREGYMLK